MTDQQRCESHDASLCTYSGREFFPFAPTAEDIHLEDIAHALANVCRFSGHCDPFYSVAQHSVMVSTLCEREDAMHGLLHDASEAYVCDVVSPVKNVIKGYTEVETHILVTIYRRFELRLNPLKPPSVQTADELMLRWEQRDLMPDTEWWRKETLPERPKLVALNPVEAKAEFIARFSELRNGNGL